MSTAKSAKAKNADMNALFTAHATGTQAQAMQLFGHHNELMLALARGLWDSQTRLLQLQAERSATLFALPAAGGTPAETCAAWYEQWREGSEHLIAQLRHMNDLMRDTQWQLLQAQAESLQRIARPTQGADSTGDTPAPKA